MLSLAVKKIRVCRMTTFGVVFIQMHIPSTLKCGFCPLQKQHNSIKRRLSTCAFQRVEVQHMMDQSKTPRLYRCCRHNTQTY